MNDLRARGLEDILIAVVDGLKGFPEAIGAVYPDAMTQTCIVHLIRNSLQFGSWKDRKTVMPDLKAIYRAGPPKRPWSNWTRSRRNGAASIQRSRPPGGGPGIT